MKTLRMIFPQWQGGENTNYSFGSKILDFIAPEDTNSKTVTVPIEESYSSEQKESFFGKESLIRQQISAKEILEKEKPEAVIVFGGDCSVSQAPFDYLHSIYPENTGIIWIDAHPDISTPKDFSHEHAMVLGNLLGDGAEEMAQLVENTFSSENILYVGLKDKELLDYEREYIEDKQLQYLSDEDIREDSKRIINWIKEKNLKQVIIHLDVDVLDPKDFKSQLTNEPDFGPVDFALGVMTLEEVFTILENIQKQAPIVGLTIAEFIPWDLIRLQKAMKKLNIFTN